MKKSHYVGVIELEIRPYRTAVNIYAVDVAEAMSKYEDYCNSIGGYVVNLYPMNVEKNRILFKDVADLAPTV